MSSFVPQEFHYRLGWRAHGARPGAHLTRTPGGVADFRGYASFLDHPDPRRIDARASLSSVPRRLMVRTFNERGAITVYVVIDLSASMRFEGVANKHALSAEIAASIAWSATRGGDAFGLLACDDVLRLELFEPPTTRLGMASEIRQRLLACRLRQAARATALPQAAGHMHRTRSLVFLISDFHFDEALCQSVLVSLSAHDVLPIVLWDSAEYRDLPRWGWARVRDAENGGERALFLRPALAESIRSAYEARRAVLVSQCRQWGTRQPFFVEDRFRAEQLTSHMLETC